MADQVRGLLSPWLRRRRVEMVRPYLRGRVLDFGCGASGVLADVVPPDRYLGVDVIQRNFERARARHPQHRFMPDLPQGETFDTIASLAVIEHVPQPGELLRRLLPLIATGGSLVLTTPHAAFEWAHVLGARLRVFDRAAEAEHEQLFNRATMSSTAASAGWSVSGYRRFLFGANQLFVLEPRPSGVPA